MPSKEKKAMAKQVLAMTKKGMSAQDIASELNVPTMKVVGIKAAISRGTYSKAGQTYMRKRKKVTTDKVTVMKPSGKKAKGKTRKPNVDKTKAKIYTMIGKGKTNEQIMAKLKVAGPSIAACRAVVTRRNRAPVTPLLP